MRKSCSRRSRDVSSIFKKVIQLRTSYKNMKDNYEPSGYAPGYFQIK